MANELEVYWDFNKTPIPAQQVPSVVGRIERALNQENPDNYLSRRVRIVSGDFRSDRSSLDSPPDNVTKQRLEGAGFHTEHAIERPYFCETHNPGKPRTPAPDFYLENCLMSCAAEYHNHAIPKKVLLISGDPDFANTLNSLRLGNFIVFLFHRRDAIEELTTKAHRKA